MTAVAQAARGCAREPKLRAISRSRPRPNRSSASFPMARSMPFDSSARSHMEGTMNERMKDEPAARLELESGYRFRVSFGDDRRDLITDLASPLGHGAGAEPTELLAAAVGSCLASSLLYCARKARIEPLGIRAEVRATPERREGRIRIGR